MAGLSENKILYFKKMLHSRFLRRIELSLKRRERLVSLSDSGADEDADDASSSLLPRELRKSNSIGILPQGAPKRHRGNKKRNVDVLLPHDIPKRDFSVTHGQTD